jgi:hypothetical protein
LAERYNGGRAGAKCPAASAGLHCRANRQGRQDEMRRHLDAGYTMVK